MMKALVQNLSQQSCHVASVILNFNSDHDVLLLIPQLAKQKSIKHSLIIVDNDSDKNCIQRINLWLQNWSKNVIIGSYEEIEFWLSHNRIKAQYGGYLFFILNKVNSGYSAGNNVGIRLADSLGADAVLIANPDMRIEDSQYLAKLTQQLFSDEQNYVAASRIIGLDGQDCNPLRESSFWEEFFWPRFYLFKFLGHISYIIPIFSNETVAVSKVSGCCLLIKMSYLRATNYLDEGIFLYCEEPILAARVRRACGRIIFVPSLLAVHAHVHCEKGNSSRRMLLFIKSRQYYLAQYSGYNALQRYFLKISYTMLGTLHKLKIRLKRQ